MNSKWLQNFVTGTAGRYLIAMAATWLANKLGFDPTEGRVAIEGVLVQGIGLVALVWGTVEAGREKVVVDGVKTPMKDLSAGLVEAIKEETTQKEASK